MKAFTWLWETLCAEWRILGLITLSVVAFVGFVGTFPEQAEPADRPAVVEASDATWCRAHVTDEVRSAAWWLAVDACTETLARGADRADLGW